MRCTSASKPAFAGLLRPGEKNVAVAWLSA
jgi:hypothetical protein